MINKIILPCLVVVIAFGIMAFSTQETKREYAVMTVSLLAPVVIAYPNGETEKIKNVKEDNFQQTHARNINAMAKKGYKLFSVAGEGDYLMYIFEKE